MWTTGMQHEWGTCFTPIYSRLKGVNFNHKLAVFQLFFSISIIELQFFFYNCTALFCVKIHIKYPWSGYPQKLKQFEMRATQTCRIFMLCRLTATAGGYTMTVSLTIEYYHCQKTVVQHLRTCVQCRKWTKFRTWVAWIWLSLIDSDLRKYDWRRRLGDDDSGYKMPNNL